MRVLRSHLQGAAAMASVLAWSRDFSQSLGDTIPLPGMGPLGGAEPYGIAVLAWARARIAAGASNEALAYLEPQLELAEAHDLRTRIIELSVAEALARVARGEHSRAFKAVARALDLGQTEGFVRIFDEGPALGQLLVDAARRGIAREYVGYILNAIGPTRDIHVGQSSAARCSGGLVEPLTVREIDVLRLLESGQLNRQIADQLVISLGTVKRHTGNIYAKLGVETRTQAIARARGLGLL
jgi:LuxR family maltose regulon positive regulatory protein